MTLKELAVICDVSAATVSNVINGRPNVGAKTRKRVLDAIERYQFEPNANAQRLRSQNSKTIGIILEDQLLATCTRICSSILAELEILGYQAVIEDLRLYTRTGTEVSGITNDVDQRVHAALRRLNVMNVTGIIYIPGQARDMDRFSESFQKPAVLVYGTSIKDTLPSVGIDDEEGAYVITDYLIRRGHKKIGLVIGTNDNYHSIKRLCGCKRALQDHGLPYDPALTVCSNWDRTTAMHVSTPLLHAGVSALLCFNVDIAAGVYDACDALHLTIGRDISVAAFDDEPFAPYLRPGLTTMALPLKEIGTKAADRMVEILDCMEEVEQLRDKADKKSAEETPADRNALQTALAKLDAARTSLSFPCRLIERSSVIDADALKEISF